MRVITLLTGAIFLSLVLSTQAVAELKPEKLTVSELKAANPHRLYLTDLALGHVIDGRVHIVDGDTYDYLGLISTGMFGITALSRDSEEMYVATTYYTKRNRGKRFDQFEAYSTKDLTLKTEIEIPAKHAQALPYKGTITASHDDRFVFIQNSTPASSVTIIDRKAEKFVTEVDTPGCWIILPAANNNKRFSTLCGDGTLVTVTLDDAGQVAEQKRSEVLFDPENDPLFVQGEQHGDNYYFVSFDGEIHVINVSGATASGVDRWSLLTDEDKAGSWKPSGYQLLALHEKTGRLYVAMHDNAKPGSHKVPATEIWAFDINSKKRVARAPGNNSIAMTLTREDTPYLYVYDGLTAQFHKYQTAPEFKEVGVSPPFGEFAGLVEAH